MRFLETRRGTVAYLGAGHGPRAFVFLHGNFASPRWWRTTLSALPGDVRGLAPALRGFSPKHDPRDIDSITALALDIGDFIDTLHLRQVTLVGHSLGGAVAMELAAQGHPAVEALYLVAPAPGDRLESLRSRDTVMGRTMRLFSPESAMHRLALFGLLHLGQALGTGAAHVESGLADHMPYATLAPEHFEELAQDAERVSPSTIVQLYRALHTWDASMHAPRVSVPTRVLVGADDSLTPLAAVRRVVKLLPSAELTVWERCGHAPMLEHPERFLSWLLTPAQTAIDAATA